MGKRKSLFLVILAVLLVAALAAAGWLFAQRAALKEDVAELEGALNAAQLQLADAQAALTDAQGELEQVNGQLKQAHASASGLEMELASTQASLLEVKAEQGALERQLASAQEELAACQAELESAQIELEAVDAAFAAAGFSRVQPQVVEELTEEADLPVAEEEAMAEEEAAAEAPAGEFFSDVPADEPVVEAEEVALTVYTAGAMGVAFEAPVDWIILTDDEESCFAMRAEESHDGVYASLVIRSADAAEFPELETPADGQPAAENTVLELLGITGLEAEHEQMNEEGANGLFRACAVVVDGQVYCVSVMACQECFEQVMNDFFLPLCESMRLIP